MELRALTLENFADYEVLTKHGDDDKPCACSFWHLKRSMAEYDALKRERPEALTDIVRQRVIAGFHVGALAYDGGALTAWISVGPLPEVYWAWKRVAAIGEVAGTTAAITCVTLAKDVRGKGVQQAVIGALSDYGRARGWTAIEAYPFDEPAARADQALAWPGFEAVYQRVGYVRIGDHWLSRPPRYARSTYRIALAPAPAP